MRCILLVEDHAWFRQCLGLSLSSETDFGTSAQAGSLAEARAFLSSGEAEGIDAAIVGLALPDGDGTDLIEEIGALREAERRIPVMVLTAIENPEVHERLRELGAEEVLSKSASLAEIIATAKRLGRKGEGMRGDQRVSEMTDRVLSRQATAHAAQTGEAFGDALEAVLKTEAGRQLGELGGGPQRDERVVHWREDLASKRERERDKAQARERGRAQKEEAERAAWEGFIRAELLELELRKDGQLARMLGEPLRGESPEQLRKLASEDRRQAEEGLVALMSGGKVSYKRLDDLTRKDLPCRIAANRLRITWLKERHDGWLSHVEERLT